MFILVNTFAAGISIVTYTPLLQFFVSYPYSKDHTTLNVGSAQAHLKQYQSTGKIDSCLFTFVKNVTNLDTGSGE
ncbi:hypothetical protein BofuT4_uP025280.1 [Botrytis cinerea T4]|uniref:Uncharacterized protein n=1 Tax=Botryotinia fuckeliana (strain T4) TaxID=999810 RepID=G2YED1_BOTF4|nr:hypothetical protein BofuT4_uP025280.1 [Botrytis cinerea T4]